MTAANVYDSQTLETLLTDKDAGQDLYGDSAYTGQDETIEKAKINNISAFQGLVKLCVADLTRCARLLYPALSELKINVLTRVDTNGGRDGLSINNI